MQAIKSKAITQTIFPSCTIKKNHKNIHFDKLCSQFATQEDSLKIAILNHNNRIVIANRYFSSNMTIMEIHKEYFINSSNKLVQRSCLLKYINSQLKCKNKISYELKKIKQDLQNQGLDEIIFLVEQRFMNNWITHQVSEIGQALSNYVCLLPQDYSHHPLFIRDRIRFYHINTYRDLKKEHKRINKVANSLLQLIALNKPQVDQSFQEFLRKKGVEYLYSPYKTSFTRRNIEWAIMVLKTRSFESHSLIPLLDMLNHSSHNCNATWTFDKQSNIVRVYALKQIQRGQQVLISYNYDTSVQNYYKWYGFVPKQQDICQIDIPIAIAIYFRKSLVRSLKFNFTSQFQDGRPFSEQIKQKLVNCLYRIGWKSTNILEQQTLVKVVQGLRTTCIRKSMHNRIQDLKGKMRRNSWESNQKHMMGGLLKIMEMQHELRQQIIQECNKFIQQARSQK